MTEEEMQRKIAGIIMPHALGAQDRVEANDIKFVHYTRADTLIEILKSKCIWMRNASCMNDYNEMRHGLKCLIDAFASDAGNAFNAAINECHEGLAGELDQMFSAIAPQLLEHTYLTCVSEHAEDEGSYGRLSMWQTYGSSTGAAIIFNNGPFLRPTSALPLYSMPVNYVNEEGFRGQIASIAASIAAEVEFISSLDRNEWRDVLFRMLVFMVVSTKHEGFRDEREWRIIHLPTLWGAPDERVPLDQVSISGVPQPIFKIPFKDYPDEGFYGVTIPDLVSQIIIGPTQYPGAIRMAVAQILMKENVENAMDRVHCSDVTLRVNP